MYKFIISANLTVFLGAAILMCYLTSLDIDSPVYEQYKDAPDYVTLLGVALALGSIILLFFKKIGNR